MKKMTRKGFVVMGAAASTLVIGGGVAFAYWTSSGSGTGSAAAGTTTSVDITQTGAIEGLYPGGDPVDITVDISNPDSAAVTLFALATTVTGTNDPGCTAADFVIDDTWAGGTVAGNGSLSVTVGTIQMLDRAGVDQNGCKGAAIDLAFDAT